MDQASWAVAEVDDTTGPVKAGVGDLTLLLLAIVHDAPP
jgi:hypothetical protein